MGKTFDRCIYCFAPKTEPGPCPRCGYDNGLCDPPGWWLSPGTILKGRYMVGRYLDETPEELCYLGWDLGTDTQVEIVEYYPASLLTRDITHSERVSCIPGCEADFEKGKQAFFEKAKLFYNCVIRVDELVMDFFVRNNTCYYARKRKSPRSREDSRRPPRTAKT